MQQLQKIGLSEYEVKVYYALQKHGALTGGEVAKHSRVPQGKVYAVLHKLKEKGFVTILDVKPRLFTPVPANIAVNAYVEQQMEQLTQTKDLALQELEQQQRIIPEVAIEEQVHVLTGNKNLLEVIRYLFENAEKQIRFMFTYEYRPAAFVRMCREAAKRGIIVQILATKMTEQGREWMLDDINHGIQVRHLLVEEIRMQVMDEKQGRITILNPKDRRDRITTYFKHGEMASHLAAYFDTLWEKAEEIAVVEAVAV